MRKPTALATAALACLWLPAAALAADTGNKKNEKLDEQGAKIEQRLDEKGN